MAKTISTKIEFVFSESEQEWTENLQVLALQIVCALRVVYNGSSQFGYEEIVNACIGRIRNGNWKLADDTIVQDSAHALRLAEAALTAYYSIFAESVPDRAFEHARQLVLETSF
jgi:hypothetical protein